MDASVPYGSPLRPFSGVLPYSIIVHRNRDGYEVSFPVKSMIGIITTSLEQPRVGDYKLVFHWTQKYPLSDMVAQGRKLLEQRPDVDTAVCQIPPGPRESDPKKVYYTTV